nr:uncharacterized protein LOC112785917 [Arachis hypogaea]
MNLRVNDEKITLNVFQEAQHTVEEKSCMRVEEEELQWKGKPNEALISSPVKQEMDSGKEKEGKEHVKAEKRRQEGIEDLIIEKEVPDIKPAVRKERQLKKEKKREKRIPKRWKNKRIPTKGFSKGDRVRLIY